jgi:hypothetical protein
VTDRCRTADGITCLPVDLDQFVAVTRLFSVLENDVTGLFPNHENGGDGKESWHTRKRAGIDHAQVLDTSYSEATVQNGHAITVGADLSGA